MKKTILLSSGGRRGQLIDCFRESGRQLGIELRVVGVDMRPELSAACQLADVQSAVPPCGAGEFIPELLRLCRKHQVSLLVPTIDTELLTLSECRHEFEAIGVTVAVSSPTVVAIARDKVKTAELLVRAGISTPRTLAAADFHDKLQLLRWPVIIKPRAGSSSIGISAAASRDEAEAAIRRVPEGIVQELWEGREYTVNMYFDKVGQLRCAVPHWRIETRAGEVSKGRTEDVPVLREVARRLAQALPGARGALCFQTIVTADGDYSVFEINARFGGGYPLTHHAGARFTTWLLEEALERPCTAADTWRAGVTMLRYDAAVFREG